MRIFKAILIFYQKIFFPTLIFSGLLGLLIFGLTEELSLKAIGSAYILSGFLFHYFMYEIRSANEYYFYYNMGLSRLSLWIGTFILNLAIGFIFIVF
jgi:hypothetical protein